MNFLSFENWGLTVFRFIKKAFNKTSVIAVAYYYFN